MKKELEKLVQDMLSACYAEGHPQEDVEVKIREEEVETPWIGICFRGPLGNLTRPVNWLLGTVEANCHVWWMNAFDNPQGGSLAVTIGVAGPTANYESWGTIVITNDPDYILW